jgi:hypothetical protein
MMVSSAVIPAGVIPAMIATVVMTPMVITPAMIVAVATEGETQSYRGIAVIRVTTVVIASVVS